MCMNCGCGEIDKRHGNEANLVAEDVRRAAAASGLDMRTTVRNLQQSLQKVGDPEMAASGSTSGAARPASTNQGSTRS